jgi:hypothetical protein
LINKGKGDMPRQAMPRRLVRWCWPLCLTLMLAGLPAWPAAAHDAPPPPLPLTTRPVNAAALAPSQPAAPQAVLWSQLDSPGSLGSLSQDSHVTGSQYNSRAADDFFVDNSAGTNSWQITAVEVAGYYAGGSGSAGVSAVNVQFYTDAAGLPGYLVYSVNVVPTAGAASGNFVLPLSPPAALASNARYWVSVQAIQSTSWYWYWLGRTTQNLSSAAWENPGRYFGVCPIWAVLKSCLTGSSPDLSFRLDGNRSANQVSFHFLFLPVLRR